MPYSSAEHRTLKALQGCELYGDKMFHPNILLACSAGEHANLSQMIQESFLRLKNALEQPALPNAENLQRLWEELLKACRSTTLGVDDPVSQY